VIPVDIYLPGCAARPESLLDAVVKLLSGMEAQQLAARNTGKEAAPPKKRAKNLPDAQPYKTDPQLILAWQQIAALWGQMSEEEKNHAAELWRALPARDKEAAANAAGPLMDGEIPFENS
jgi:hypothetical protein